MSPTRRQFIVRAAGCGALVSFTPRIPNFLLQASEQAATQSSEKILVVIQLSGGNDALNTIVPYGDDAYHRNRLTLAQTKDQVLKIDDHFGFHPALKGFADLNESGRLTIVQGVGYPNPNRSHFESMDIWHAAGRDARRTATGWVGRALDQSSRGAGGAVPALHLGAEVLPLALVAKNVRIPTLESLDDFQLQDGGDKRLRVAIERAATIDRSDASELTKFVQDNLIASLAASDRIGKAVRAHRTNANYPESLLSQKLRSIAQLIDAQIGSRVYYVTLNGFDTHSEQADVHAGLLKQLGDSVLAFCDDLAKRGHGERVTVMSFSEFGRRVKENASRGTDHGAAAPMFLAGGAVKGGLVGKHPSLTDLVDGDLKFHTDFRQVYATVLRDWLGIEPEAILAGKYPPLDLFG